MSFLIPIIAAAYFVLPSSTQFIPAPNDLISATGAAAIPIRYKQVPPDICELDPSVKSYSGYADVAPDQHIFWWFFEAREDPEDKPLTLWINGGPGSSSMLGLFQENGPCFITPDGKPRNNPYSWTSATNMLYIDQPTQVGFSYSIPIPASMDASGDIVPLQGKSCPQNATKCGTWSLPDANLTASSTPDAAPNFWKTLQGFMGVFPQYAQNDVIFGTESYGGKYGPIFSEYIMKQNDILEQDDTAIPGALQVPLSALLIGNGWFDPLVQYQAYYNFTVSPGNTYDLHVFNSSTQTAIYNALYRPGGCVDMINTCYTNGTDVNCAAADDACYRGAEQPFEDMTLARDSYDVRYLNPSPFPPSWMDAYLNSERVQRGIGAFTNFSSSSGAVGNAFAATGDDARVQSVNDDLRRLVGRGVTVALYFGDADYICNWVGGEAVADALGVDGFDEAGFVDFETPDNIVHGQVKQAGNFAFIRVFESGHMVPFFKPLLALEMLRRAAEGRDFATGAEEGSDAFTEGPASSRYREGNATVQWVVVPETATYNTLTNMPNAWNTTARTAREKVRKRGPPKKIGIPSWLSRNRGR